MDRLQEQLVAVLEDRMAGGRAQVPEAGLPLWNAFTELAAARTYGFSGPNPIAWAEIEAWARLMRWPLEPRHVRVIRALDQAWMAHGGKGAPTRPTRPLTPEAFDAAVA